MREKGKHFVKYDTDPKRRNVKFGKLDEKKCVKSKDVMVALRALHPKLRFTKKKS